MPHFAVSKPKEILSLSTGDQFTYPFQYIVLFKLKPHNQALIKDYLRKSINEPLALLIVDSSHLR